MRNVPVSADQHPFLRAPHRTLVSLSIPVLLSLIAEPLTGLVDTAFVARQGSTQLAALGVGTIAMSSVLWIFNFLGIGSQTEVARALGAGDRRRASEVSGLALLLSVGFGLAMFALVLPLGEQVAIAMGAHGKVTDGAALYLRIRAFGAPAVLVTTASFGALRGLQDMRTPLQIAVAINVLNIALDAVLIPGAGPIPSLGIAGAAWATVASQWLGGLWAVGSVRTRLGFPARIHGKDVWLLLVVGRDLFLRTGLLSLFLLLTTRAATKIGAEAGAAHQAVRQVWLFTALVLDAFAAAAQSLIGYFRGAGRVEQMRRVALVACAWSLGTGFALAAGMWAATAPVAALLVPETARALFAAPWLAAAAFQPMNALAFATDGIHWGTSDYRFLRNVMGTATALGAVGILLLDVNSPRALLWLWVITGIWITTRSIFGMARIWPGIGRSPFRTPDHNA